MQDGDLQMTLSATLLGSIQMYMRLVLSIDRLVLGACKAKEDLKCRVVAGAGGGPGVDTLGEKETGAMTRQNDDLAHDRGVKRTRRAAVMEDSDEDAGIAKVHMI